jgi:hypothetical protein
MQIHISPSMHETIVNQVQRVREEKSILEIYKVAEGIRCLHIEDNIALEDIVEALLLEAGSKVAIHLGSPEPNYRVMVEVFS